MPFEYEIHNSDGTITNILLNPESSSQVPNDDFLRILDNLVRVYISLDNEEMPLDLDNGDIDCRVS